MHTHNNSGKRIAWVILFNLAIVIAEYIGGMLSGSLALLSDAGHNFSDVLSLNVSYFGERFSHSKATKKHSFGFKRFEVVAAFVNAISLCTIGIIIITEAFGRVISNQEISLGIMLPVAIIGLLGNIFSVILLTKEKGKNLNMKSAYLHLAYDALSSVFVIIAAIVIALMHFVAIDVVMSVVIALMMIWSGFGVLKQALHIFMQGVPESIDFQHVNDDIISIDGISGIHDLHIWSVNSEDIFLSCHACLNEEISKKSINEIIQNANSVLKEKYGITHSAIQFEYAGICEKKGICCEK